MKNCPVCGVLFDEVGKNGHIKISCSDKCRDKKYYQSAKGKAMKARSKVKFRVNHPEKGLEYQQSDAGKAASKRYWQSLNGRQKKSEYRHRWLQTEKGRACIERHRNKHKNTWYYKRDYLIYVLGMPCVGCGEIDKSKLEGDHILPRALGGTDDWGNLQVLCEKCHEFKSTQHDFLFIRLNKCVF